MMDKWLRYPQSHHFKQRQTTHIPLLDLSSKPLMDHTTPHHFLQPQSQQDDRMVSQDTQSHPYDTVQQRQIEIPSRVVECLELQKFKVGANKFLLDRHLIFAMNHIYSFAFFYLDYKILFY